MITTNKWRCLSSRCLLPLATYAMARQQLSQQFKIIELNTGSLISHKKRHEMETFLTANDPDVVLLCETNLSDKHIIDFKNYDFIRKNKTPGTFDRGSGVLIKSSINHTPIDTRCWGLLSLECTATIINTTGRPLAVVSAYRNPSDRTNKDFAKDLTTIFNTLTSGGPVIVGGDFNARHTFLHDSKINDHGKILHDWFLDNFLQLSIKIESSLEPTRYSPSSSSFLDLFIVSESVDIQYHPPCGNLLEIVDFESDHRAVVLPISLVDRPQRSEPKRYRDYNATNWGRLRDHVETGLVNVQIESQRNMTIAEIDKAIVDVSQLVITAIEEEVPTREVRNNTIIRLPSDLVDLIQHKNRLRRRWQRTQYCMNAHRLKSEINNLSKIISDRVKMAHSEYWTNLLKAVKPDNQLFRNINRLSNKSRNNTIPTLMVGTTLVENEADKAEALAVHFEAVHTQNVGLGDVAETDRINRLVHERFGNTEPRLHFNAESPACATDILIRNRHIVSTESLKLLMHSKPNKKSAGHDGIPNIVLRKLGPLFFTKLATLFNQLYNIGHFPQIWKNAKTVAILKHGNPINKVNSYRPIALLPCIGKLYESVIQRELVNFTEFDKNILPDDQMGFRPQRSTVHALTKLQSDVATNLNHKRPTIAISLDVAKAFDTTWIEGIVYKLAVVFGANEFLCRSIFNYLTNRHFSVQVGHELSSTKATVAGVPQGGVLSATLYTIYTADLPDPPENRHQIHRLQYADDILIYVSSPLLVDATHRLECYIKTLSEYFEKWKLRCNPEKSEMVLFKGPNRLSYRAVNRLHKNITINTGNNILKPSKSIKYLGMIFEKNTKHTRHIDNTLKKAHWSLMLIRPLLKKVDGLSPHIKTLCYKQLIRPVITYGFPAWANATSHQIERIRLVERKILRSCTHYCRNPHNLHHHKNSHLYRTANIPRIDQHLVKLAIKFFNNAAESESPLIKSITNINYTEDQHFKPPWHLMNSYITGRSHDNMDNLIFYHRRNQGIGPELVYNTHQ